MILPQGVSFDPQLLRLLPRRTRQKGLDRLNGSLFGILLLGVMVCIIAAMTGLELFWLTMASAAQE